MSSHTVFDCVCVFACRSTLEILNYVFVAVFTIEAVLKLVSLGLRYWADWWNVFDFTIVVGSLIGIAVQVMFGIKAGPVLSVIRTFRIGRVFRLIRKAKALNVLFQTLLVTLPSYGNVSALLFLLLFIYSVIGVQLFATVKLQSSLNYHANYQSFGRAMLTLFRGTTGEAWDYIMADLSTIDPSCDPVRPPSSCPSRIPCTLSIMCPPLAELDGKAVGVPQPVLWFLVGRGLCAY